LNVAGSGAAAKALRGDMTVVYTFTPDGRDLLGKWEAQVNRLLLRADEVTQ